MKKKFIREQAVAWTVVVVAVAMTAETMEVRQVFRSERYLPLKPGRNTL